MKRIFYIATLTGLMVGLAGCSAPQPTPTPLPPTATPLPPAAVTLYYEESAQVELISSKGTRVLIDAWNPAAPSSPATEQDILLTTHLHGDHINTGFQAAFKGQQLYVKAGEIKSADVAILGLASGHNDYDPLLPENGTNYIYIIDMDGLRIAHFGDIGQNALTDDQLAALGKVDVAITQFSNSYSSMNLANEKGFNLMAQVKPRLIIPTHTSLDATQQAATLWTCLYSEKPAVKISQAVLTDETQILFLGQMASSYGKITKGTAVDW